MLSWISNSFRLTDLEVTTDNLILNKAALILINATDSTDR